MVGKLLQKHLQEQNKKNIFVSQRGKVRNGI